MDTTPRRAVTLTLKMEADSLADIEAELLSFADMTGRRNMTRGVSGAARCQYVYEILVEPHAQQAGYFKDQRDYLDRQTAPVVQPGAGLVVTALQADEHEGAIPE